MPHDLRQTGHQVATSIADDARMETRDETNIIEAIGLTKRFGKRGEIEALAGLDLRARTGSVTAVLGPNGAGKTTFIRAVATLLRPDSGSLHVAGVDAVQRVVALAKEAA